MTEPQEPRSAAPVHLTTEELSECAFSPETAAAGLLGHAEGCARCSAELADLRLVLTELAALPEPELPVSVGIRLEAAVARAWQEADAEASVEAEVARRRVRRSWRKIAIPLGALSLIALAVFGVGTLLGGGASVTTSAETGAAPAVGTPGNQQATDSALVDWVHNVLPSATYGTSATASEGVAGARQSPMTHKVQCAAGSAVPQRAGYAVLTSAQREYEGKPATLVVYQDTQKPASTTVYAVAYAGFCLSSSSAILDQGYVSR